MKKLHKILVLSLLLLTGFLSRAQDEELPEPSLGLHYYNVNGRLQYIKVKALIRQDNQLQPVRGLKFGIYLDSESPENLVGNFITDDNGDAKVGVPARLEPQWKAAATHTFLAVSAPSKTYAAGSSELEVAQAKFVIDTLKEEDTRQVSAQLLAYSEGEWVPVPDADVKLAVRRLGGDLNISEESYTTDSAGMVTGEFGLKDLPAVDAANHIVLVAKTEDADLYGNVIFEKKVPWGVYTRAESNVGKRSLWGTRDQAPVWLLLLANFILFSVWGVLVYLLFQIRNVKRAGRETPTTPASGKTIFRKRVAETKI